MRGRCRPRIHSNFGIEDDHDRDHQHDRREHPRTRSHELRPRCRGADPRDTRGGEIFARADTDGDGALSSTEFVAMHEQLAARRGGPGRGGPGAGERCMRRPGAGADVATGGGGAVDAASSGMLQQLASQVQSLSAQVQALTQQLGSGPAASFASSQLVPGLAASDAEGSAALLGSTYATEPTATAID